MRILQVHNRYTQRGGEDSVVEAEAELLKTHQHEVNTLLFDNHDLSSLPKHKALRYAFHNPLACQKLRQEIQRFSPEIIHFHNLFYYASPALLRLTARLGIPTVCTLHNYRLICINAQLLLKGQICTKCVAQPLPWQGLRHRCFHQSFAQSLSLQAVTSWHKLKGTFQLPQQYIVLTRFAKQLFSQSSLKLPPERFSVKPNFAQDLGYAPAQHRKDFFLFVGRLSPEKGIHALLETVSRTQRDIHILGDGPLRKEVTSAAERHPNLRYLGFQPHNVVTAELKACQALIIPSLCYEGFPQIAAQAFSTGTPVVAFDNENMKTIVQHQYDGYLAPRNNVGALVKILKNWRALQPQYTPYYAQARQSYETHYTPKQNYERLLSIYEKTIQGRLRKG